MNENWQRSLAILLLALLGGGIVAILFVVVFKDGKMDPADTGWLSAGFLSLREVFSKIEKIALGVRTPAPPLHVDHPTEPPTGDQSFPYPNFNPKE